jgi:methyl-accepting chemotaxis protein
MDLYLWRWCFEESARTPLSNCELSMEIARPFAKGDAPKVASYGLSARMYLTVAIPIILFVAFSAGLWVWLDRLANDLLRRSTDMAALTVESKDMQAHVIQVQQFLTDVSATRGLDGLDDGPKLALEHRAAFLRGLDKFAQASKADQIGIPAATLTALRTKFDRYYNAGVTMANAYVHGGPAEGNPMMEPFDKASTAMQEEIQPFVEKQASLLAASAATSLAEAKLIQWLSVVACAAAALVAVLASWRLVRSIVVPVDAAVQAARRMADGDLSVPVQTRSFGEIATLIDALTTMQTRLSQSLRAVQRCAGAIELTSNDVSSGSQNLSQRTELTASNLQQTTGSIAELGGTLRLNAQSAGRANELSGSACEVARRGGDVVAKVVTTMQDIHGSARRIADITGVIDGIAFQTNILALNAAVEAARAGEQGRGFAVVASEVRVLAQRSGEAAREIRVLIGSSVDRVETGTALVSEAGETMSEIVASVERLSTLIGEISSAAAGQDSGISQVQVAVGQIDEMTRQNAQMVEQSAAAADNLQQQVGQLRDVAGGFRLAMAG